MVSHRISYEKSTDGGEDAAGFPSTEILGRSTGGRPDH
jgi:hypothetical protein